MTRGKRLVCPRIVIHHAAQPEHATRDDAWVVVEPVLARILAQTTLREQAEREKDATRKSRPSG